MKPLSTRPTAALLLASVFLGSGARADAAKPHEHSAMASAQSAPAAASDMTNAEVRKVDVEAKKITLKHEAIKNLDMPGMTMVFLVKDAAMLEKVKVGDKVKIKVVSELGKYVVTELLPAQ